MPNEAPYRPDQVLANCKKNQSMDRIGAGEEKKIEYLSTIKHFKIIIDYEASSNNLFLSIKKSEALTIVINILKK